MPCSLNMLQHVRGCHHFPTFFPHLCVCCYLSYSVSYLEWQKKQSNACTLNIEMMTKTMGEMQWAACDWGFFYWYHRFNGERNQWNMRKVQGGPSQAKIAKRLKNLHYLVNTNKCMTMSESGTFRWIMSSLFEWRLRHEAGYSEGCRSRNSIWKPHPLICFMCRPFQIYHHRLSHQCGNPHHYLDPRKPVEFGAKPRCCQPSS